MIIRFGSRPRGSHELRKGDRGRLVELLQKVLHDKYGYQIPVDGFFGKKTEMFVKKMQNYEDIEVTGYTDDRTWARLLDECMWARLFMAQTVSEGQLGNIHEPQRNSSITSWLTNFNRWQYRNMALGIFGVLVIVIVLNHYELILKVQDLFDLQILK
ncbi:MAG: peptidoglycan-binding domain-containing protein [Cyanobacteria bacterium P01_E01_bin.42]